MIWKQTLDVETLHELQKNTMSEWLGVKFLEIGDDFITASMPITERTRQPMGLLHGGASTALAETLGSIAAAFCVNDPADSSVVGVEINATHLRSAKSGEVIAKVTPIKIGRRLQTWHIEISQHAKKVCVCRLTTMTTVHSLISK